MQALRMRCRSWQMLWMLMFLATFLAAGVAQAEESDLAVAVNKSGYLRMLSQRIVKAYCQVGLGVMPEASKAQLMTSVDAYAENLRYLRQVASGRRNLEIMRDLDQQWEPFRVIASGPVTLAGAAELLVRSEMLLQAAEKLTMNMQAASGTPYGQLINLSGRQRMLSQRLAKFYMLHAWGFETALVHDEIEQAHKEFSIALAELSAAPQTTLPILDELEAVRLQWDWFQAALVLEGALSYRLVVADASETILKRMDYITGLYEAQAKRQQ